MTDLARRSFLGAGLAFVVCAPAIVRVSSLMPVKSLPSLKIIISADNRFLEFQRVILQNIASSMGLSYEKIVSRNIAPSWTDHPTLRLRSGFIDPVRRPGDP